MVGQASMLGQPFIAPEAVMYGKQTSHKREGSPLVSARAGLPPVPPVLQTTFKPRSSHAMSQLPAIEAERMAVEAMRDLLEFLKAGRGEDEDYLVDFVQKRKRPQYDDYAHILAVTGGRGQGKSFTIENLIGYDFGRHMGGIFSMTNVILEYRPAYQGQETNFLVEMFLYPKEYILKKFEDELYDYRRTAPTESDEEGDEEEECSNLTKMLGDLFAFRRECCDDSAIEDFLKNTGDVQIMQCVRQWLDIVSCAISGSQGVKSKVDFNCTTPPQVERVLATYTCTEPEPFGNSLLMCCPYRLIEKAVSAQSSPVLNKGNHIRDAPGMGDMNKAHVDLAHMALRDAEKVMVVHSMNRCVRDKELTRRMKKSIRKRRHNVFLVLTHSAELADDEYQTIRDKSFNKKGLEAHEKLMHQLSQIESEIEDLVHREKQEKTLTVRRELDRQIRDKKIERNTLQNRDFQLHVRFRNRRAVKELIRELRLAKIWTYDFDPIIRCIDNKEFERNKKGQSGTPDDTKSNAPRLSLAATGVPQLQHMVENFPADGRWATLKHFINETCQSTMNILEMSGSFTKAQKKEQVDGKMASAHLKIEECITEMFAKLETEQIAVAKSTMEKEEPAWIRAGLQRAKKAAADHHHATHQKIIRNFGFNGEYDLNEELLKAPWAFTMPFLENLQEKHLPELFVSLVQRFHSIIEELLNELDHDPKYDAAGLNTHVRASIRARKADIAKACTEAKNQTRKSIRILHDCVHDTLGDNSYFSVAMQPVYEKALKAKATKRMILRTARCKALDAGLAASDGPYHQLHTTIIKELTTTLKRQRENLIKSIGDVFAGIQNEVNMVCSKKEDTSKEAKARQAEKVQYKMKMQEKFDKVIRPKLLEAEEMSKQQRAEELRKEELEDEFLDEDE